MVGKERIRVDVWASLKPIIESEIERTGLTANELINMALCDYFGLSPSGKRKIIEDIKPSIKEEKPSIDDDEDYV